MLLDLLLELEPDAAVVIAATAADAEATAEVDAPGVDEDAAAGADLSPEALFGEAEAALADVADPAPAAFAVEVEVEVTLGLPLPLPPVPGPVPPADPVPVPGPPTPIPTSPSPSFVFESGKCCVFGNISLNFSVESFTKFASSSIYSSSESSSGDGWRARFFELLVEVVEVGGTERGARGVALPDLVTDGVAVEVVGACVEAADELFVDVEDERGGGVIVFPIAETCECGGGGIIRFGPPMGGLIAPIGGLAEYVA